MPSRLEAHPLPFCHGFRAIYFWSGVQDLMSGRGFHGEIPSPSRPPYGDTKGSQ